MALLAIAADPQDRPTDLQDRPAGTGEDLTFTEAKYHHRSPKVERADREGQASSNEKDTRNDDLLLSQKAMAAKRRQHAQVQETSRPRPREMQLVKFAPLP